MKNKQNESIMDMFNLPSYTKGKTFAEASKAIAKKFEGRTDRESVDTLNDLQNRLKQAQEYVKSQSEPASPSQEPIEGLAKGGKLDYSNDYFLGGIMNIFGRAGGTSGVSRTAASAINPGMTSKGLTELSGGSDVSGQALGATGVQEAGAMKMPNGASGLGAGGYAQLATTAMDLGQTAFKKPDVNTSGLVDPGEKTKSGISALGGAAKGAKAGMMFGPLGAAVGGVIGGAAGFFGGKKKRKAQIDAAANFTYAQARKNNNDYAGGGFMNNIDPNELIKMLSNPNINLLDQSQTDYKRDTSDVANSQEYRPLTGQFSNQSLDEFDSINNLEELNKFTSTLPDNTSKLADTNQYNIDEDPDSIESKYDPSTLLRYAPAVTDAYQLATLKKPEQVMRSRLSNRYNEQLVDEMQLQKGIQEGIAQNRDAILGSSGGSQAAARANLLGLSVQGTKALGAAMAQAAEQNRAEKRAGQQFNLGVDTANLQQSNAEQLANEQNQGAYEAQKSKLISQLGLNLGEVGKEQLFKKYPELMGMDFNALGKYLKNKKKK